MRRPRILVIEDDPAQGRRVCQELSQAGYDVHLARGGPEGLGEACRQRPDLVLTEICLPDRDGFEILDALRRQPRAVPVVAMTGGRCFCPGLLRRMALALGARRVLLKPLDPDVLHRTLLALLPADGR